ncbi:hypothetical protein N656DRAFT_105263 [Canariomyces notabilis]|uniref:Uncharacterized protein n=1 Tax=Canariomyces notabilis TaxID=2074819 RepID=A0AAN6YS36_9PEZI|nr:hypothetical protein N656DRAFT_105263 [Canariomyces arenarius]
MLVMVIGCRYHELSILYLPPRLWGAIWTVRRDNTWDIPLSCWTLHESGRSNLTPSETVEFHLDLSAALRRNIPKTAVRMILSFCFSCRLAVKGPAYPSDFIGRASR